MIEVLETAALASHGHVVESLPLPLEHLLQPVDGVLSAALAVRRNALRLVVFQVSLNALYLVL